MSPPPAARIHRTFRAQGYLLFGAYPLCRRRRPGRRSEENDSLRFSLAGRPMPDIMEKTLSRRLRELEQCDIAARTAVSSAPPDAE
ncbi:winged helix-turn-helix transcriptional regulator [Streptomyces sp. NPDC058595]|uniref:winged helix-turn-helix transcriptional regulator n=1 Tax=Streptomyces sp. NPDC058595 TaxID=3346550 RepID=UPI0036588AE6